MKKFGDYTLRPAICGEIEERFGKAKLKANCLAFRVTKARRTG